MTVWQRWREIIQIIRDDGEALYRFTFSHNGKKWFTYLQQGKWRKPVEIRDFKAKE